MSFKECQELKLVNTYDEYILMLEERIAEFEDEIRDLNEMIEINEADYLERMNKCIEELNGQILMLKDTVKLEENKANT